LMMMGKKKVDVVVYIYNPSTPKAKAVRSHWTTSEF
jgi:hypothetical protein